MGGDRLKLMMDKCGFVRENRLANVQSVRQDMNIREEMQDINIHDYWGTLFDLELDRQINTELLDYETRANMINEISRLLRGNNLRGIIIDFAEINDEHNFERFIIELTPRLREIGISTGVHFNGVSKKDPLNTRIKEIVDYIAENK